MKNMTIILVLVVLTVFLGRPLCPTASAVNTLDMLNSLDKFAMRQIRVFDTIRPPDQPAIPQTYGWDPNTPFPADPSKGRTNGLDCRGDIYDLSACMLYLLERAPTDPNMIQLVRQLADTIAFLQERDPKADGRIRTAYRADTPANPLTGVPVFVDASVGVGNMAWVGSALAKYYNWLQSHHALEPSDEKYLNAAKGVGDWIIANCKQTDQYGGFSLGLKASGEPWTPAARSTEHNIALFVLGRNLFHLTAEAKWDQMASHARDFVCRMYHEEGGKYWIGTHEKNGHIEINYWPISADAQALVAAAMIDDPNRAQAAMNWLEGALSVCDTVANRTYCGIKFSTGGSHINSEATAQTVIASRLLDRVHDANELLAQLELIRLYASPTDDGIEEGVGIVATPEPNGASTGFADAVYPNLCHLASSMWAGLSVLMSEGDLTANPGRSVHIIADFDKNSVVNFLDFALLAENWRSEGCDYPDWCSGFDLDHSNEVDAADLAMFSRFWLRTMDR